MQCAVSPGAWPTTALRCAVRPDGAAGAAASRARGRRRSDSRTCSTRPTVMPRLASASAHGRSGSKGPGRSSGQARGCRRWRRMKARRGRDGRVSPGVVGDGRAKDRIEERPHLHVLAGQLPAEADLPPPSGGTAGCHSSGGGGSADGRGQVARAPKLAPSARRRRPASNGSRDGIWIRSTRSLGAGAGAAAGVAARERGTFSATSGSSGGVGTSAAPIPAKPSRSGPRRGGRWSAEVGVDGELLEPPPRDGGEHILAHGRGVLAVAGAAESDTAESATLDAVREQRPPVPARAYSMVTEPPRSESISNGRARSGREAAPCAGAATSAPRRCHSAHQVWATLK